MPGRECYHCHQWVEENEEHNCWTIYASHNSIMFSRQACYFFVRPKKKVLEVWFFLGRILKSPLIRKTQKASKLKVAHMVHITHRDYVEPPLTDWLKEAYDTSERLSAKKSSKTS